MLNSSPGKGYRIGEKSLTDKQKPILLPEPNIITSQEADEFDELVWNIALQVNLTKINVFYSNQRLFAFALSKSSYF